ncbi:MAG: glycosyltransferase family 2 protein [Anaerolineae bacterium]|nr:glycosyltransferase family 2 protein [Anaerolineae bacterium]
MDAASHGGAPAAEAAPGVGIVIVNWNLVSDTLACLNSVYRMSYSEFQVVVVDNGSTDDSVARIAQEYPKAAQIVNDENLGFAAGANQGIGWAMSAGCAYALVLNNDTTVAPDLLQRLIGAAERDPRIGILSPRILYFDRPEQTWHLAARWHRWLPMPVHIWNTEVEIVEADFVSGCGMMLRSSALEAAGYFDTSYFMYGEDVDLCIRIKAAGYRVVAVPGARMWHKVSTSAGQVSARMRYWQTRNQIWIYRRHMRGPQRWLIPGCVTVKAMIDGFRCLAHKQASQIQPLLRGVLDGMWGTLP